MLQGELKHQMLLTSYTAATYRSAALCDSMAFFCIWVSGELHLGEKSLFALAVVQITLIWANTTSLMVNTHKRFASKFRDLDDVLRDLDGKIS